MQGDWKYLLIELALLCAHALCFHRGSEIVAKARATQRSAMHMMSSSLTSSPWSQNIAQSLPEIYFQAAESLSAAIEARQARLKVDVMTPGLHPALEKQAPGSNDLVVELVMALLPSLHQHFNQTKLLFMSTGDSAFGAAYLSGKELLSRKVVCAEISARNVGPSDTCIMYVTPQNSVGDAVITDVESCVQAAPQATHIILNGKLDDMAALGISERDRHMSFLGNFKQAYYFRNLVTITRPTLEPIERGACVFQFGGNWELHTVVGQDLGGPGSLNRFSRSNYFRRTKGDPTTDSPPRFVLAAQFPTAHGRPTHDEISVAIEKSAGKVTAILEAELNQVTDATKARVLLQRAAEKRDILPDTVFEAMVLLEKQHRSVLAEQKRQRDAGEISNLNQNMFDLLGASWRLIFTTGTAKAQEQGVKINYFPVKAVQTFNTEHGTIQNGIFFGPWALLQFSGAFKWIDKRCRLEFEFDKITIGPISFSLPKPSEPPKKQPCFDWIEVNDRFCVARGAGGGLALWLKEEPLSSGEEPSPFTM